MVYIDADQRNADWIKVVGRAKEFSPWSHARVKEQCAGPYRNYVNEIRERHLRWFAARPAELRAGQAWSSATREGAFPPGWGHLAQALPTSAWHRHHLSAGSSQVLALALVAAAEAAQPNGSWLPHVRSAATATIFEVELGSRVLNERPRKTSLDVVMCAPEHLVVGEAKFTEAGLGRCSCERRDEGVCSPRVEERPYWDIARRELGLRRQPGRCAVSLAYQAVRNVAAAAALARGRQVEFVLFHDTRNPYFTGAGEWPGWVAVLTGLMAPSRVRFSAVSWQALLGRTALDPGVVAWAREKHGLVASDVA